MVTKNENENAWNKGESISNPISEKENSRENNFRFKVLYIKFN
jgi:hypothetical protein